MVLPGRQIWSHPSARLTSSASAPIHRFDTARLSSEYVPHSRIFACFAGVGYLNGGSCHPGSVSKRVRVSPALASQPIHVRVRGPETACVGVGRGVGSVAEGPYRSSWDLLMPTRPREDLLIDCGAAALTAWSHYVILCKSP